MNADSPRVRLSRPRASWCSPSSPRCFARLWYLQVMVTDEFQVEAQANRVRVVPVEAPARSHPRPQRHGARRQPHLGAGHASTARCSTSLEDDERLAVLTRSPRACRGSGTPKTVEEIEDGPRQPALQPVRAGAGRRRRARGPEDLDRRARRPSFPGVAAERVAVRHYPYGQLAAHVLGYTGQINDEEFEEMAGLRQAVHAQRRDREVRRRAVVRGRPARHAGHARDRGRRREPADPRHRRRATRSPATTSSSTSTSTCRPRPSRRCRPASRLAQDRPCRRLHGRAGGRRSGSTVVLDPKTGGVVAMASYPSYRPVRVHRRHQRRRVGVPRRPDENNAPLNNWAHPGPVRAGLDVQAVHRGVGAAKPGCSPPRPPSTTPVPSRCPSCTRRARASSATTTEQAYGVVDLRRSLTVSSDVFYYGIGARFWVDQDALGGPESSADLLQRWGFDQDTGIDLPVEQAGRIPSPSGSTEYCEADRRAPTGTRGEPATTSTWPSARATCSSRRSRSPTPTPPSATAARCGSRMSSRRSATAHREVRAADRAQGARPGRAAARVARGHRSTACSA